MNALELADALDNLGHNYTNQTEIAIKSATMLRQQQAEIEALKRQVGILKQDVENWIDNAGQQPDEAYWESILK